MKKLLLIGSVLLCYLFILSGCTKEDSKQLVLNTYESWKEMNMEVWILGPTTEADVYSLNEGVYMKVNDDKFASIADIKGATEEICTKSGAEKMFYDKYLEQSKLYCEKDGELYRLQADIPANYGGELEEFKVLESKENYIHSQMTFSDGEVANNYTIDIILIMENGKWLVDDCSQKFEVIVEEATEPEVSIESQDGIMIEEGPDACDRAAQIIYQGEAFIKSVFAVGADMLYVYGIKENGDPFFGYMQQEDTVFNEFIIDMDIDMRPFNMTVDRYGNCHILWMSVEKCEMDGQSFDQLTFEKSYITIVNKQGQTESVMDVTEVFGTIGSRPFCFVVDRDGDYYIEKEKSVIQVTKDGHIGETVICDGGIEGIGIGKSGNVYCTYYDASGIPVLARLEGSNLVICDVQLPEADALYSGVYAGTDTELLLINKANGIYACGETSIEQRVHAAKMPISGQRIAGSGVLADGRVCLMGQEYPETTFYYVPAGQ